MQEEHSLTPITGYSDDLARAGALADSYARAGILADYQMRLAANTRRRQQSELAVFCEYLAQIPVVRTASALYTDLSAWAGITHGLIEGYLKWQLGKGVAINTINIRLATIKRYCALAARAKVLSTEEQALIRLVQGYTQKAGRNIDRAREVCRIGAKKAEPTVISPAHAGLLKRQPGTPLGRRDALLMCLLLDHGLRVSEIVALKVADMDLARGRFAFYREKVDLVQIHTFTPDTLKAAQAYLPDVAEQDYLFAGSDARRKSKRGTAGTMETRSVNDRVRTLGEGIGITRLSPHDCRHFWATEALAYGTSIDRLQQAGGWTSPAMPLRYANTSKIANEGVKLS